LLWLELLTQVVAVVAVVHKTTRQPLTMAQQAAQVLS
jgi:hypothetical protein